MMEQWLNSDAFYLSFLIFFSRFWDVIDHVLSFCNALGLCLVTQDLLTKTVMRQWWDSDATVMLQWCSSDETVMQQWCLWFELFFVNCKLLGCHWPFFIILQCLGGVLRLTRPFDKNSDQTVMRHWWDSDETVMEQWCNSDRTVMEQWCVWFDLFYVIFKLLRCHWSYYILKQCLGSVVIDLVVKHYLLTKTVM
jgi:hypothetical protein